MQEERIEYPSSVGQCKLLTRYQAQIIQFMGSESQQFGLVRPAFPALAIPPATSEPISDFSHLDGCRRPVNYQHTTTI